MTTTMNMTTEKQIKKNYLVEDVVERINLSEVKVGDRFRKDYKDIKSLTESIQEKGLINPITVRRTAEGYDLMAGGRRLRALKMLNLETSFARVYSDHLSDMELRTIELEENVQREDLTWQEECELKKEIYDLYVSMYGKKRGGNEYTKKVEGISTKQMAKKFNESGANFRLDLQLAKAAEQIPQIKLCKTKADARKVLKAMSKDIDNKKAVAEVKQLRKSKKLSAVKQELIDAYVVSDVFSGMKKLRNETFNLIECDPPYAIDLMDAKKESGTKTITDGYTEVARENYREFVSMLAKEFYRILKHDSYVIFWFAYDHFTMIYEELINAGFTGNAVPGFWIKPSGQTKQPMHNLASCIEPFFYLKKGSPKLQKARLNKFEFKPVSPTKKIHPTERPLPLIEELLLTFAKPKDSVFVPFLGSGKTLIAAHKHNMFSMGCDLDVENKYKPAFIKRIMNGELDV